VVVGRPRALSPHRPRPQAGGSAPRRLAGGRRIPRRTAHAPRASGRPGPACGRCGSRRGSGRPPPRRRRTRPARPRRRSRRPRGARGGARPAAAPGHPARTCPCQSWHALRARVCRFKGRVSGGRAQRAWRAETSRQSCRRPKSRRTTKHWPAGLGSACGAGVRAAGAGVPVMMIRLSGRSCSAAAAALKRFSVVESATSTSEACAPMRPASLAPTRSGRRSQSCLFQDAIRSAPHSACTTCRRRARRWVDARRASRAAGGLGARARLAHALGRGPGQGAQGVAVEVDEAVGQQEALAEARQGVARVQPLHVLQAQRARAVRQARVFSRRSVVGVWNHSACAG